jgi:transcriptional regulator with XRE-family HTH domain
MTKRQSDPAQGLNAAVAAVLNGERVAAGMTFDELATVSGVSKQQLMRLLSTTKRHIDVEVLELLAASFGTTSARVVAAAQERLARLPDAARAREAMRAELVRREGSREDNEANEDNELSGAS